MLKNYNNNSIIMKELTEVNMTKTEKIIVAVLLTIVAVCVISMLEPRHELKAMIEGRTPRTTLLQVKPTVNTGKLQKSADNKVVNMQVTRGSVYLQNGFDSSNLPYVILGEF